MFPALLLLLTPQDDPVRQAEKLIEQLHSEDFNERSEATRKLKEFGAAVIPIVEKAAQDPDFEVAQRARDVLQSLRIRATLSPRMLRRDPGIVERLAGAPKKQWTAEFVRILDQQELGGLRPWDLDPLVAGAFAGAQGRSEVQKLIESSARHSLRSAYPALLKIALGESLPDLNLRADAVGALLDVDAPAAGPGILKLLGQNSEQITLPLLQSLRGRLGVPQLAESVRPILRRKASSEQVDAIRLLSSIRDFEAVDGLEACLENESEEVRLQAAVALGDLQSRKSSGAIRKRLQDSGSAVRRKTIESLGRLGAIEAAAEIEALLAREEEPDVLVAGCRALARLGYRDSLKGLERLAAHEERSVQWAAFEALWNLGFRREATAAVERMLRSPESVKVDAAALYIGMLRMDSLAPAVVERMKSGPVESQSSLSWALATLAVPETGAFLQGLLKRSPGTVRTEALRGLARMKRQEAVPDILALLTRWDPSERGPVLLALGALGHPDAAAALGAALEDPSLSWSAMQGLLNLGGATAVEVVKQILDRGKAESWQAATALLVCLDASLLPGLLRDPRGQVRLGALEGANRADLQVDPQALLDALNDPEVPLRYQAVLSLRNTPGPPESKRVLALMADPDWHFREEGMMLAGRCKDPDVWSRLIVLLEDDSESLAQRALESLARLAGPEHAELLARWAWRGNALAESICSGLYLRPEPAFPALLEQLLLHSEAGIRESAARLLCRHGSSRGVPVLLAGADGFLELNELRQPELFRSLQARPSLGPYRGSRASLLERCAREAGLALELPSTVPPDPNHAYDPREGINRWWSPGSLLDDLGGGARGMELILEKDRVRVVHEEEARIFWERWWAEKRR